ncbi:MAG: hypothetical protein J5I50_02035 [Chitinophagaceae bacterium]|nr:hypothetical protein [Chitinophagaceae bacterium]
MKDLIKTLTTFPVNEYRSRLTEKIVSILVPGTVDTFGRHRLYTRGRVANSKNMRLMLIPVEVAKKQRTIRYRQ